MHDQGPYFRSAAGTNVSMKKISVTEDMSQPHTPNPKRSTQERVILAMLLPYTLLRKIHQSN